VTITTAAEDLYGNNLIEEYTWNFTTGLTMGKGPAKIISLIPEPDSTVEINTKIKVGFDRDIISQNALLVVKNSNGTELKGVVKYSDTKHIISFTKQDGKYFDYNSIYSVELVGITVDTGEFSITSGNKSYKWSFSTKPMNDADSDTDGINDKWELENDLDPFDVKDAKLDPDNDGLNNLAEFKNQTNPNNKDSDNDGLLDIDELVIHLTDPNNDDSDDDGSTDGYEIEMGTDPNSDKDYPGKKTKDKEEEPGISAVMLMIIAIIAIIIIIIIIAFFVLRGRKGKGAKTNDIDAKGKSTSKNEKIKDRIKRKDRIDSD
jgi:hypothetical protein